MENSIFFVTIDTKNFTPSSIKYVAKVNPFDIMFLGNIDEIENWEKTLNHLKKSEFVAVPCKNTSIVKRISKFKNCIPVFTDIPSKKICEKYIVMLKINKNTIENIGNITEICKKMGAVELLLIRDFNAKLTSKSFKTLYEKIQKYDGYVSVSECPFFYVSRIIKGGCVAGWGSLHISGNNIFPCFGINISAGNVKNIENAFNSEIMKSLRKREKIVGKCRICEYLKSCGGCRAHGFVKTGNIYQEDEMCWR